MYEVFCLKRHHNDFSQVQPQLFTVTNRKHCDFVVCAISPHREAQIVIEHIYPDLEHWQTVVPKVEALWRVCILPEILGRWYTRKYTLPMNKPSGNGGCFCHYSMSLHIVTQNVQNFIHLEDQTTLRQPGSVVLVKKAKQQVKATGSPV